MSVNFHSIYDWTDNSIWIADSNQKIAQIQTNRLQNLVLQPGNSVCVTWLTLFWWQYADNERPGRSTWILKDMSIDDRSPECYRLFIRTCNADRSVVSECKLTLTYDAAHASYVYEVDTCMEVQPGKEWVIEPQGGVEFANPWYKDAAGSAVDFPGAAVPRWHWVIYTDPQGNLIKLPLNHLGSPLLERIQFPKNGGWLGFFNSLSGNPVIELDADTAAATRAEVCAWGYDVHFIRRVPQESTWEETPLDQNQVYPAVILKERHRLTARYRLYGMPAGAGERLIDQAVTPDLPVKLVGRLVRPAFTLPVSNFIKGIDPTEPSSDWYWAPSHSDGVTWERSFGRSDHASLHIHNEHDRMAYWEVPIGPDFWMGPLAVTKQHASVWIRTRGVNGGGAYFTFRYSNYPMETGQQPRLSEQLSKRVTGSNDWTQATMEIAAATSEATRAYLRLVLEGPGEAWFDDLILEPAK